MAREPGPAKKSWRDIDRAAEFAPVKNRSGADSPQSAVALATDLSARWLTELGVAVALPPEAAIEISPRYAATRAELQQRLRTERDLIPNFIEECLRFESPVKGDFRLAKRNTTVGGVDVPAGTTVMVMNGAANRDPRQFENPGVLDIERTKRALADADHLRRRRVAHPGGIEFGDEVVLIGGGLPRRSESDGECQATPEPDPDHGSPSCRLAGTVSPATDRFGSC